MTEKNNHIRNLTEKISVLERVIKEKEEMFEKTNQELTVECFLFNNKKQKQRLAII
jgi:hypothetical protein